VSTTNQPSKNEITALVEASSKVATLLEGIYSELDSLKKVENIEEYIKHILVDQIVKEAIIEKGLDMSDTDSKISKELTLLKDIKSQIGKLIWVIVICVGVLGGVKGIGDWYYNKSNKFEQHLTIHFDIDGAPYILDPVTNAKIWIVPTKPEK
jgi:hypothetical protein